MTDSKEALIERLKRTANAVDLLDSGSRYTISMRRETKAVLLAAADALASLSASVGVTDEQVEAAAVAGWNACRKSLYAVCEDVEAEGEHHRSDTENAPRYHFGRGYLSAANSIARGFGAMEALDDDNLTAAIEALPLPSSGGEVVIWVSSKQRQNLVQGGYVAARAAPEGNFDTPLYARATESGK